MRRRRNYSIAYIFKTAYRMHFRTFTIWLSARNTTRYWVIIFGVNFPFKLAMVHYSPSTWWNRVEYQSCVMRCFFLFPLHTTCSNSRGSCFGRLQAASRWSPAVQHTQPSCWMINMSTVMGRSHKENNINYCTGFYWKHNLTCVFILSTYSYLNSLVDLLVTFSILLLTTPLGHWFGSVSS